MKVEVYYVQKVEADLADGVGRIVSAMVTAENGRQRIEFTAWPRELNVGDRVGVALALGDEAIDHLVTAVERVGMLKVQER